MKKFRYIVFTAALFSILVSCERDSFTDEGITVLKGISKDPDLSTLSEAIDKSGLKNALNGTQYTFYAPTNQAFIDAGINIDNIDSDSLLEIMKYHVLLTRTDSTRFDLEYGQFQGQILRNQTAAPSNPTGILTSNYLGVFTYLGVLTLNLDVNANLYYTQAIKVIDNPTGVIELEGVYLNGAKVTALDAFEGGDGVVHKIDRVLSPPAGSAAKVIESDPELSLFEKLVKKASSNGTLGIPRYFDELNVLPTNALLTTRLGSLTILAPTDAAMTTAGFTSAAIDAMTITEAYVLARKHVLNLRYTTADFLNLTFRNSPAATQLNFTSQNVSTVTYNNTGADIFFSTATTAESNIVAPDVVTTNGFLHKIDTVLQ